MRHFGQHAAAFLDRAAEGDHQLQVRQAHFVADLLHGPAFQRKAVAIPLVVVARRPAEAEHRVFFGRLERLPADQVGVFVGLEVADSRTITSRGIKRRGDHRHALGQLIDEELRLVGIAGRQTVDLRLIGGRDAVGMQQGQRMDLDVGADDELQARQPDAVVGKLRQAECFLGIADVHHDLGLGPRRASSDRRRCTSNFSCAFIDEARLPLGARHGDLLARLAARRCRFRADDRRQAQLAADDGGVAGPPAAVGDDRRRLLHRRLPVGIGLVGHEHIARLDFAEIVRTLDDAHRSDRDLLPDAAAADEHRPLLVQLVDFQLLSPSLRLHRFRPGLHDEELARAAVLGPFHIHRRRIDRVSSL